MNAPLRLRPTRRSGALAATLALMWAVSANYGNNLGFLFTYLLAGVALAAARHTRRQLQAVSCRPLPAAPVFAGERARLPLAVENTGDSPKWGLAVALGDGEPVRFSLAPGESRRIDLPWPAPERGVHRIGAPRLWTLFPSGWFRAERAFEGAWTLWVYPAPVDGPPPPPGTTAADDGEREFDGFRAYRPGDAPRQIHWKGLAKGQGLLTKTFAPAAEAEGVIFDWRRLPPAPLERRLGWLCRWLLAAERAGRHYGLRLPTEVVAPGSGPAHLHACLRALARMPGERP